MGPAPQRQPRRRRRRLLLLAFALVVGAAGCSSGDGSGGDAAATDTTVTDPDTATSTDEEEETAPSSSLQSVGEVDRSQVEIRVAEILSDLEASPEPEGAVVDIPDTVLFDFDSAELKAGAAGVLDDIAEVLLLLEDAPATVRGHTDDVGEAEYNRELSQQRADAVVAHLVDAGVPADLLTAEGIGEDEPVAPNSNDDGSDNEEGRAANRRVEVVLPTVDLDELP